METVAVASMATPPPTPPSPASALPPADPSEVPVDEEVPSKAIEVDLNKHPSGIVPQLQNVVSTCYLGRKLDLKHIALHARNAEYNPKRFAAVIMRIREPKTTALIFSSGKMVCTGAKSESDSRLAARKYARVIQKLGFDNAKFQDFKIQNIVASCDVRFPIRLEGLQHKHGIFSHYEPELFPGLIYRMKKPKVVLLIFVSGKVVLTGAKHRDEIYEAFEMIHPALLEFRKGDPQAVLGKQSAVSIEPSSLGLETTRIKIEGESFGLPLPSPGSSMMPTSPSHMLPPPTPWGHSLPPPTPSYSGLPPSTPMHSLPPCTPSHVGLPPPTPSYKIEPQFP
ncbi:unnamed protein product [Ostreobium quekettii]|uniref:Uncharacterized protein n=1 Tax=Ostreobium quekettii TaxID=121088 RepID=A0A8S1J1I2_9CHLO|nr:unnamed protein product [Ostreobium quekettii]|eukprot:evm.model.scf_312.2 EVM.evm.TU.scf_312.2   scf_312:34675-36218(-)